MPQKKDDVANNYVPKDYEELYRYYIIGNGNGDSLCHKIIRNFLPHSDQDERETLAHDVFVRAFQKDVLRIFDPSKANFGGVIYFVTRTICVNHLSRKSRNPVTGLKAGTLSEKDPEDEFEPGMYSLDRLFVVDAPDYDSAIDNREVIKELMARTKALFDHPRHKRDQSLYPLLNLLAEQNDPKECGAALGVTPSTIHNWLGVLKQMVGEIRTYLEDEDPPVPVQGMPFTDLSY